MKCNFHDSALDVGGVLLDEGRREDTKVLGDLVVNTTTERNTHAVAYKDSRSSLAQRIMKFNMNLNHAMLILHCMVSIISILVLLGTWCNIIHNNLKQLKLLCEMIKQYS